MNMHNSEHAYQRSRFRYKVEMSHAKTTSRINGSALAAA
jgi:hypothetical protein